MQRADRPVFLNLARIRYPVGALASIGHRISGLVLVLVLPFAVLALERSLSDEAAFFFAIEAIRSPLGRAAIVLIAWAGAHHLLAGIRHLLSDVGVGASLATSRRSAYAVLIAGALVAGAALVA
ncbi:MAG TPA: succinate dehydrogenase, cytochrome b556 subunit [Casimicrobiaceae bacterium]